MAEIGNVKRFTRRGALTAFAGVDSGKNESEQHMQKSVPRTKKGSPNLRKTFFQIMDVLMKRSPVADAIYAFMDKKRAQSKPYYVYMTFYLQTNLCIGYHNHHQYSIVKEQIFAYICTKYLFCIANSCTIIYNTTLI